ncbi:MAG: hypothetical protein P4L76_08215 [Beijerinckiaceae bacterium]|nr:hypothetical protein [Beijerinckiaceae bacterium]
MKLKLPEPVAAIYKAVEELELEFKKFGRKFTPDGHLVGSIGEVIAAKALNLRLLSPSHPRHDAEDENGKRVQIKMTAGKSVSLYDDCERLVVLKVVNPEEAEIVYDGPGAPAWAAAGDKQKNGQKKISLSKLKTLNPNGNTEKNRFNPLTLRRRSRLEMRGTREAGASQTLPESQGPPSPFETRASGGSSG